MTVVRVAAVGDVHLGPDLQGRHRAGLLRIAERADVLLLAGDLTRHGTVEEARIVAEEYTDLGLPTVAVLGNHDYHSDAEDTISDVLVDAGIVVLEGEGVVFEVDGTTVGVAGVKGFGLGFAGRCGSAFGEPETKAFVAHGRASATSLADALATIDHADVRIALTHYAPTDETLIGEPPEIWPFLGNHLLGEAIDRADVHLALHGHAHAGRERGVTPKGVRVRNVAQPVIRAACAVYDVTVRMHTPAEAAMIEYTV